MLSRLGVLSPGRNSSTLRGVFGPIFATRFDELVRSDPRGEPPPTSEIFLRGNIFSMMRDLFFSLATEERYDGQSVVNAA